jgi:uncharacterized protein YndB with AHSA1/START domain
MTMVDIASQLGAVDRGIRTTDIDGVTSYVQTLGQTYPSPIDDVWEALTTAPRIARWFLPVSGDLTLGGRYQFEGNAGGEVLACEPPTDGAASFRVSWGMGPGTETFLAIRLTGDGERTHLELEHVAAADILPPGMWEQFGPAGTGMGWDSGLLGLSLHLAHPEFRDEFDAAAWTASDEGVAFLRGSADAWAVAHEADGVDAGTAKAAADATFGMYTGQIPGPDHSA